MAKHVQWIDSSLNEIDLFASACTFIQTPSSFGLMRHSNHHFDLNYVQVGSGIRRFVQNLHKLDKVMKDPPFNTQTSSR